VVVVRGDPGVGKSRLVSEVIREAQPFGFRSHVGFVLDFGTGQDRNVLRAVVASLLGAPPGADAALLSQETERAISGELVAASQAAFLYDLVRLPLPVGLRTTFEGRCHAHARSRTDHRDPGRQHKPDTGAIDHRH
jgi:hypothetical protein